MTLTTQFYTMLSMLGMGALFGLILDTYQRFLNRPKRKQWIVFINDVLFWMFQALLVFYALFQVNQGEIRFYIFIALLCGFAGYQGLLKGIYLRVLEFIIYAFVSAFRLTKRMFLLLVFKPVRALFQLAIIIILFLGRGLYALVKFVFKVLQFCLKLILKPIGKIAIFLWKLLPKGIKKNVEKLYNKIAGNFKKIVNIIRRWKEKRKK